MFPGGMRSSLNMMRMQFRMHFPFYQRSCSTKAAFASTGGFSLLAIAQQYPFQFQVVVSTIKTSIADIITQTQIEGKSITEIDTKRNLVFVVFGATYLGGFQWWLQVTKFRQWFPGMDRFANATFAEKLKDVPGMISAGKQVAFDVFVHLPFMYFPCFYTVKEFVQGKSWNPIDWAKDGCTKYYNNFRKDTYAMFCLWAPADCVLFAVPMWLRMPGRHLVSLGWTAYLSFLRGAKIPEKAIEDKK
ncbi:hypothetical protein GUITHDRAFT_94256 [Guillardia theta CCMP2712]|uniref:Uncharacterized protein n=2 Tax=Guillardia theta TaxID=55529 RepID=L1JF73_GUITC|nr:hypothetical protein GUITHDRAFT_94256 [Guillardia theta CCMP2712]EKX46745.1 hypothetical protein GUITHDRAFT_94256 [Guillardia theta CCMP2712]|mmetsp:Transcript_25717/g.84860  ORF Transcript_25717/g.84860 Transcript_25717/m.84860 type:complete len:245 (+) Transcript_25717:487-1221(+)|eukprot:XP_005833725.1 hypothetical protein GUITHDRAFT_94256 [Guillardia theta CCMP2712]